MTEGETESVSSVGRLGKSGEVEKPLHHPLHLLFAGVTAACDRFLGGAGRIFGDVEPFLLGGEEGGAARHAELEGDACIFVDKLPFNGKGIGLPLVDQRGNTFVDDEIAIRQLQFGWRGDTTIVQGTKSAAFPYDDTITR